MLEKIDKTFNFSTLFINHQREVELKGFWKEISHSAPRAWLITCVIGVIAVVLSFPADFQTFKEHHLLLALGLRAIILIYFILNILLVLHKSNFVKSHFQFLMASFLYLTGIPLAVMSVLGGAQSHLYFMGIIEIEFAAATFFTISRGKLILGISIINLFYIIANIVWGEWMSSNEFTNVWVSILIFAVVAIYAHHTILGYKIREYLKRQELVESEYRVTTILSRITNAFFALDNSWRFIYFNREAELLLSRMKRTKEAILGKSLWEEFPNLSDSIMRAEFLQSKEKNLAATFEEYYPLLEAHMEVHAYPSPEGMTVYLNDISIRKLAEDSLRKSNEELEERVLQRTAQLRELSAHTDTLREEEWKRISREIHDELGQTLTGLKISISCLRDHLCHRDETAAKNLNIMSASVSDLIDGVRRIASELRPVVIDDLGLAAAVEWYVSNLKNRGGIVFHCSIEPEVINLDPERSIAIYRVLQEALNNAIRHARPTSVDVILHQTDMQVVLEVRDNGIGFVSGLGSPRMEGGLGLLGMKERVVRFDGTLSISGMPGVGTTLRVEIPYTTQPERSSL